MFGLANAPAIPAEDYCSAAAVVANQAIVALVAAAVAASSIAVHSGLADDRIAALQPPALRYFPA